MSRETGLARRDHGLAVSSRVLSRRSHSETQLYEKVISLGDHTDQFVNKNVSKLRLCFDCANTRYLFIGGTNTHY